MFGRRKEETSRIDTLIGKATRVDGDVRFTGGLHLDGRVTGSVTAEGGSAGSRLSVSDSGVIDGSVNVPQVVLNGAVRGDIVGREKVVLGPQSRVEGNVLYGVIEIADGATIRGRLVSTATQAAQSGASAGTAGTAPAGAPGAAKRTIC